MSRKYLIAGNWKMNKTATEAVDLVREIHAAVGSQTTVQVCVCPPFTSLAAASAFFRSFSAFLCSFSCIACNAAAATLAGASAFFFARLVPPICSHRCFCRRGPLACRPCASGTERERASTSDTTLASSRLLCVFA